jgi:uncharacterized protein (TIGR00255 family)
MRGGAAMIRGMTGFGRAQGQAPWGAWAWEVRSVNGKAVDVRANTPPGFDAVDFEARKRLKERFSRGSFQMQLRVDMVREAGASNVDTRELARLARLSRHWKSAGLAPSSVAQIAALPGLVRGASRTAQTVDEAMAKALIAGLDQAFDMLDAARKREGDDLLKLFNSMLADFDRLVAQAAQQAANQPALVRERLKTRMAELAQDAAVDPDRIAQEAILMANRADVREELDRLTAHVATARDILNKGEAAGRKLDFLCQELNRETNTLCSKSASLELTNTGLALKSLNDQFREQVQNVE